MADNILEDDDIIDLTDLLEEGDPKKKERRDGSPARANEPDSFDLGKEISMEYEVSVEEIEQGSDGLDIDASLSSNEETALIQEKEGGEGAPLAEEKGAALFDDDRERDAGKAGLSRDALESLPREEEDSPDTGSGTGPVDILDAIPDKAPGKAAEEPVAEPVSIVESTAGLDKEKPVAEELTDIPDTLQGDKDLVGDLPSEPVRDLVRPQMTEVVLAELRQEVPAMLEEIVKPLVSELVREMVTATREQLPGIVEKVIREEIEKLKKLES